MIAIRQVGNVAKTMAIGHDGGVARSTNTRFAVAVHVLTLLAGVEDDRVISSEELADSTGANSVHVRRVLGPLREAGLVRSHAGARGGWELSVRPEEISLGTVWRLLQGDDPVLGLHGPNPSCVTGKGVQQALTVLDIAIADALAAQLEMFSVRDVLDGKIPAQLAPSREKASEAGVRPSANPAPRTRSTAAATLNAVTSS